MKNDIISENTTPVIDDSQLEALLGEFRDYTDDMQEIEAPAAPPAPRRSNRTAEQEEKLRRNARRFYRTYFILTALLLCGLIIAMIPLRNWLVRFETTQPDHQSQQVFNNLFAQQDWGKVYDAAKVEDSAFEDRDDFIYYMQSKVSAAENKEISYYETSAGLSKDHKYIVTLGQEKIAVFTLTGGVDPKTEKTEWSMNSLQLTIDRNCSVSIQKLPGYTVLINGKEVSDDYIVRNILTNAEAYLPEGVHGFHMQELHVDDLMVNPTVEVLDANGNSVQTTFDTVTNRYLLDLPAAEMTTAEKDVILGAAKANALFAIRAIGTSELSKYFDSTSQIYKDICNHPNFTQAFTSYSFDETVTKISEFYRYNDDLFSARVTLQLDITRKNGTVKSLEMNTTYIFTKNAAGAFLVTNITNVNLQEQIEQVRLTFACDGEILDSMLVDTTANTICPPQPTIPDGQVLLGWATRTVESDGKITMDILFVPNEDGTASVLTELTDPITLYAVFGDEGA